MITFLENISKTHRPELNLDNSIIQLFSPTGLVGLAISYALSITGLLSGLVNFFTETEKEMVSVERVLEYIEKTPKEFDGNIHVSKIQF